MPVIFSYNMFVIKACCSDKKEYLLLFNLLLTADGKSNRRF